MQAAEEHPFERGFQIDKKRKYSWEFGCAVILYLSIIVHAVLSIVIFASKNSEVPTFVTDGSLELSCPSGMMMTSKCMPLWYHSGPLECISESLCEELKTCVSTQRRLSDTITKKDVPSGVWEFMEEHFYQPTVLFGCAFICAGCWLVLLQTAPKTVVWGTIAADILMLVAIFLYFLIEEEAVNWACIILVALMIIGCGVLYKKINHAAVMMKFAMDGLFANKRIFGVAFGVQLVWVGFFALWVAGLVAMHFVKEVGVVEGRCEIKAGVWSSGGVVLYWVLHYYWVTYFLRNVNVIVITAAVSGWYFEEDGYLHFWKKSLPLAFGPLAGGTAICSAIMGMLEYLLSKVGNCWNIVFSVMNPLEWIFLCIALAMKGIAQTYTKFGLIAHAYGGRPFCETAPRTFTLLKNWLGEAVVCDYVGKRVMSWMTFAIALGVAFAAWAWADAVQNISSFGEMSMVAIFFVSLAYAWILSQPFFGLLLVIFIEDLLGNFINYCAATDTGCLTVRAVCNSVFASLFMGCITFFILNFLSQVVVNAMDVCLFCYAVECDLGKPSEQDVKKQAFFESIKETVVQGSIQGQQVVTGGPATQMMTVSVPEGCQPGQQLMVATPQGQQVTVVIPEGVAAGQTFQVQVPAASATAVAVPVASAPAQVVGNPV
mmetsp:Transcript_118920/g.243138  ORF Transcript_118920/g.243138 Transcript_118920/m.243138 type:complete len:657 (+) Transcript_118920:126-2096(+)